MSGKREGAGNMKTNKKGVSLAFVIVVVLALVIFSSLLFSAAARSLSMTGESTEGREAYLRAKSAIEYAKTEVYSMAKSNRLAAFSVGPDGDGFRQIADRAADGTACLAECKPGSDGKTWTVTAKVKYSGLEQYRQMSYSFKLERKNNLPASPFFLCGVSYGLQSVFTNGFYPTFYSSSYLDTGLLGRSDYPVLENLPVAANLGPSDFVSAPEAFFWGMSDSSYRVNGASIICENVKTTIHSDMIGIAGDISGVFYGSADHSYLFLQPCTGSAVGGVVYFNGQHSGTACTVSFAGGHSISIPKGYYWFDSGVDLFDLTANGTGFIDSHSKKLVPLAEYEATLTSDGQALAQQKNAVYEQDIDFIIANAANMISGSSWDSYRGINWAPLGLLGLGWPSQYSVDGHWWSHEDHIKTDDKIVCLYVKEGQTWVVGKTAATYCAKQIFLQFTGDGVFSPFGITESNNLTFPSDGQVVFQADLISISMLKTDTNSGTSVTDRPAIVQPMPNEWLNQTSAQFIVKSLDGVKNVTLVFPRDVGVYYYVKNGNTYKPASYVIPKGVYSVESGYDFFSGPKDWSACRVGDYSPGISGFTITPGKYSAP